MTEKLVAILNQLEAQQQQQPPVPKGIRALELLQMVYRGEIKALAATDQGCHRSSAV
jgi:hypothetical protein